jgi:cbb3-type cytochrome oxidase subunit 3
MEELGPFLATYGWFIAVPLIFIIIALFVFRPGAKRKYRKDAEIPFKDEGHRHD